MKNFDVFPRESNENMSYNIILVDGQISFSYRRWRDCILSSFVTTL